MLQQAMDAEEFALYPAQELARYLRMPASTVRYWLSRGGRIQREPAQLLSFEELISLLFVRELRVGHNVPFKEIARSERDLRARLGKEHPFAWEQLWTAGRDVMVRLPDQPDSYVATNRLGQVSLPRWVEAHKVEVPALLQPLRAQVEYRDDGRAFSWRPSPHVIARPAVQFGLPCVDGTRLPTKTVLRAVTAGDTVEQIAFAYGADLDGIRAAVEWEQSLAA